MTDAKLFEQLKMYVEDDIAYLEDEGYKRRPGNNLDRLYNMLDECNKRLEQNDADESWTTDTEPN